MTVDAMALELAGARIAELEHDLIAYREIATQAIHALHRVTRERDRLREQLRQSRQTVATDDALEAA